MCCSRWLPGGINFYYLADEFPGEVTEIKLFATNRLSTHMHADKGEPSGLKGGNINIKKKTKQQKQHQLSLICDEIYREILFHDGNERVCAH